MRRQRSDLVALLFPNVVLPELLRWIAGWAVATGGLEIAEGLWLRREEHRERLLLLLGLQSMLVGGLLLLRSSTVLLGALGLLAGYSLAGGFCCSVSRRGSGRSPTSWERTPPELWAASRL